MTEKEFNLSEKIQKANPDWMTVKNVKEFIRLVKKSNVDNWQKGLEEMEKEIDKLAGEKLCAEQ